jgi:hypothetical protein
VAQEIARSANCVHRQKVGQGRSCPAARGSFASNAESDTRRTPYKPKGWKKRLGPVIDELIPYLTCRRFQRSTGFAKFHRCQEIPIEGTVGSPTPTVPISALSMTVT